MRDDTKYVGFFSDKTNTFFAPYVEVRNGSSINDCRNDFVLGRKNKLYLYVNIDGEMTDLDELPTCSVDGKEYAVRQHSKGIYYSTVKLPANSYEPEMILSDVWGNISLNGDLLDDVEMEFITKQGIHFKPLGNDKHEATSYFTVAGLNYAEKMIQGDERRVELIYRKPYTGIVVAPSKSLEYRIYIKDGKREVDAIAWDSVDVTSEGNFLSLRTKYLLPSTYHIDVRYAERVFKDLMSFTVVSNSTDQKK